MQCVPLPEVAPHEPSLIPIWDTAGYDGGEITAFPERQGWKRRPIREWMEVFDNPPPGFVDFVERWLFFGLAQRMLSAEASDFIDNVRGPILTTRRLPEIVQRFRREMGETPERWVLEHLTQCIRIHGLLVLWEKVEHLDFNRSRVCTLLEYIESGPVKDPRRPAMVTATSLLYEAVFRGLQGEVSLGSTLMPINQHHETLTFSGISQLWHLLVEEGWCPSETNRMFARSNTSTLWFLYHLPNPFEDQNRGHEACEALRCERKKLNDKDYKTKHVTEDCCCDEVTADLDKLCKTLKDGEIPLIRVPIIDSDGAGADGLSISLSKATPDLEYIAISHVWSDGLGNPNATAIPTCQFKRLSRMVNRFSNTRWFWLDTLCVPPDTVGRGDAQKTAMELMRKTYEDAKAVLVLDSWVLQAEQSRRSDVENLHRIFYCGWNSRLWTFQEGALARVLLFQFRDGLYNVDEGLQRLKDNSNISLDLTVKPMLISLHDQLRGFQRAKGHATDQLRFVVGSTALRTTSVADDETLCLAALLDLPMETILTKKGTPRMVEFWTLLESIPASVVFCNDFKKMSIDGFRWAPETLIQANTSVNLDGPELLSLCDKGLEAAGPGLLFRPGGPIDETLKLRDEEGNWFLLNLFLQDCDDSKEHKHPDSVRRNGRSLDVLKAYGCSRIAFVVRGYLRGVSESQQQTEPVRFDDKTVALLVLQEHRETDGHFYGRFLCTGTIRKMGRNRYENDVRELEQAWVRGAKERQQDEASHPDKATRMSWTGWDLTTKIILVGECLTAESNQKWYLT